ncbi:MAG: ArsA-related P-loop ATPase [Actinomycetota bacterium]|nr:ArsA-related P-loop ATPase [Actinomycetota bacterium]
MSRRTMTVIVTGAGGVGKTTISAAIAIRLAGPDRRTVVMTVDPARRLADALDLHSLSNEPSPVPGVTGLWASTLDASASWEGVVHRYSDPDVAERLLKNNYFRAIADRFPAAQSFAAAETMSMMIESGNWDAIVVDTPPSAGGLDFFLSPSQTAELIGGRLLRWLTGSQLPGRRFLYRFTGRPILMIADAVLGGPLLEDVAEFLLDLRTMYDRLASRAATIKRYQQRATTLVATTADPAPMAEVLRFFEELTEVSIDPAAVILNRALPLEWTAASRQPIRGISDAELRAILKANLVRWGGEARRQATSMVGIADRYGVPLVTVPWVAESPTTVDGLSQLLDGVETLDSILEQSAT